ncbi:MAG: helix-turn-helix domain-containing protein [Alphaproteobacteria bacterium]
MKDLDIAEVARMSGLPASALRFYEENGLIRSIGRRGLRRLFDPSVLERLGLIALGQAAGFSIKEIGAMFGAGAKPVINREKLAAKADVIDKSIRELIAMRNGLRHAAACPASNHFECPKFRRLVRAAGAGALKRLPRKGRR